MPKVKEHDKIILYVKQNLEDVEAVVTMSSHNGTVLFRPLKNLDFDINKATHLVPRLRLCAGTFTQC